MKEFLEKLTEEEKLKFATQILTETPNIVGNEFSEDVFFDKGENEEIKLKEDAATIFKSKYLSRISDLKAKHLEEKDNQYKRGQRETNEHLEKGVLEVFPTALKTAEETTLDFFKRVIADASKSQLESHKAEVDGLKSEITKLNESLKEAGKEPIVKEFDIDSLTRDELKKANAWLNEMAAVKREHQAQIDDLTQKLTDSVKREKYAGTKSKIDGLAIGYLEDQNPVEKDLKTFARLRRDFLKEVHAFADFDEKEVEGLEVFLPLDKESRQILQDTENHLDLKLKDVFAIAYRDVGFTTRKQSNPQRNQGGYDQSRSGGQPPKKQVGPQTEMQKKLAAKREERQKREQNT